MRMDYLKILFNIIFEHRDLHWGNITIKPTKVKSISYNLPSANINVAVETFGVRACIIDYTLSRMERGLLSYTITFI